MDTTRIKVRIGEHEFEAEGPVDIVQSQFDAFKEIISLAPRTKPTASSPDTQQIQENKHVNITFSHIQLEKILHVNGRIVSLTALPASTEEAALLVMLGHKDMRNNLSVTGQEIGDGLAQSGRPVPRVDRLLDKAIDQALVLKSGIKRGTRYRLTNQGHAKALAIARELTTSLP
jgi:hypothetical protein